MTTPLCPHGRSGRGHGTIDDNELSSCCNAAVSIFIDDGVVYCKCCFGSLGYMV